MWGLHENTERILQRYRQSAGKLEQMGKSKRKRWQRKTGCHYQKGDKGRSVDGTCGEGHKNPSQGTTFFKHYFNAKWQTLQFQNMKKDLPDDNVLQVMDFAKNREIKYQDEIKATYYTANQVTLHPIVNFYKTDLGLVRESCVIISEYSKHDYHAVHHYQDLAINHISEQTQLPPSRFLVWSDGCSSQYEIFSVRNMEKANVMAKLGS